MMSKEVLYSNDIRSKILSGVSKLENAVAVTLGAKGRNVLIDEGNFVHPTKDGVTVARAFDLKDKFENIGVKILKEVAEKSNSKTGDGTTSSVVLASSLYKNGLKHISMGANATQVKRGMEKVCDKIVETLKNLSQPCENKETIKFVATVSANGDEEIGEIISEVMSKIGKDGAIKIEDGNTTKIESKIVEGMSLDNCGYISPYFVNNERMECDFDHPYIMIVNKKVSNIQELLGSLQDISQTGNPLLIIAEDVEGDAISTLVLNKLRGQLQSCAIKSPSYGTNRLNILEDIAVLTGGQVISDDTGVTFDQARVGSTVLGSAKRVIVNKDSTIVIGGNGNPQDIENRIKTIRTQIENTTEEYEIKKLRERLAKLSSGVGVISVGAKTEAELKEKRDRVDDAFSASKCAIKSGILPGGGVALFDCQQLYKSNKLDIELVGDENIGANIVLDSLSSPLIRILENAGIEWHEVLTNLKSSERSYGYDVLTDKIVPMFDAGIIDPTDVVISEIENAVSIAGIMLTTECAIVNVEDEKDESPPQMPMM